VTWRAIGYSALGIDKSNAGFFANRAAVRLKLHNAKGAEEDGAAALKLDPTHIKAGKMNDRSPLATSSTAP